MAERILAFPAYLFRRLAAPAALGAVAALLTTFFTQLVQRSRRPTMPRMSDEWLRAHRDARSDEWGGFSW